LAQPSFVQRAQLRDALGFPAALRGKLFLELPDARVPLVHGRRGY
jgi:hypothetical protein